MWAASSERSVYLKTLKRDYEAAEKEAKERDRQRQGWFD